MAFGKKTMAVLLGAGALSCAGTFVGIKYTSGSFTRSQRAVLTRGFNPDDTEGTVRLLSHAEGAMKWCQDQYKDRPDEMQTNCQIVTTTNG